MTKQNGDTRSVPCAVLITEVAFERSHDPGSAMVTFGAESGDKLNMQLHLDDVETVIRWIADAHAAPALRDIGALSGRANIAICPRCGGVTDLAAVCRCPKVGG